MLKTEPSRPANAVMIVFRLFLIAVFMSAFISNLNPARVSGMINRNASLFTCAVSYTTIGSNFVRALDRGWITQPALTVTYLGAVLCVLAVAAVAAAFCLSLGNTRMRRLALMFSGGAAVIGTAGTSVLLAAYSLFDGAPNPERVDPVLPAGIWVFYGFFALTLVFTAALMALLPKPAKGERYELAPKYRLFLMALPFLVLVTLFAYLPLWGWRYAFSDYNPGFALTFDDFVGLKWLRYLFSNAATRADIVRVMKNTFAMSGLGIATAWLPMVFAIFLAELRSQPFKRGVQTLTTIPNYISWVLVYSVAFAIFSTEGFFNWMLVNLGIIEEGTNHLMSNANIWLKMWAWGTWKGLGWSAIIYIAGISSIDPQLYEAATVDGAERYRRMWHITVPGLLPTFFVLLLLSIANILTNGLEQYLVFDNPANRSQIQVLDLYIYHLGIASPRGNIPLATMIGMLKTIISVTLLFGANRASKWLRGETIV